MDKPVHEVRLSNWIKIVSACQSRPKGVTQKQWISENGMTRNQYYYWQRKVRKAAYLEQHSDLPQSVTSNKTPVAFVEFPSDAENLKGGHTCTRIIRIPCGCCHPDWPERDRNR